MDAHEYIHFSLNFKYFIYSLANWIFGLVFLLVPIQFSLLGGSIVW